MKKEKEMKDIKIGKKMRTSDLNNQIKQKIKKDIEAELKNKEFDLMMDKHYAHLDKLEKQKKKLIKARAKKEKELRDKQINNLAYFY